jgi:hypothetical protein
VLEPEQWKWSSYRSYALGEEGMVKINQWPKVVMRVRGAAYAPNGREYRMPHSFANCAKGWAPRRFSPIFTF